MAKINPYINFKGNCEEAFNFYKSVFGGEFLFRGRYKDMPPSENGQSHEIDGEKIMHISLPVGQETLLMGSDVGGEWAKDTIDGNNIQISISAGSEQEATQLFNGLSVGGRINMPLERTFWGSFFGMLTDKFGINWMVDYDYRLDG
ncbi:VOC family protein [Dyadobacter sp. LHD-138]|uniref:VOC family protein n=1 Tax=Dyadobacter sp. LHD-138 TaxID=3071413 RepID=UPI0027DF35E4|nr:VOC family protein [Dyadobacter sp. LHD-138]MDQ6480547.1 VOC family protein [Dyadobacter sp. LHD-138]